MSGGPLLFSPYRMGDLDLPSRMVMPGLTRSRAGAGGVPGPLAEQYYGQRASAGLIVTEGSQVSTQGVGYIRTPGIHSAEQVAGWRRITDAVHAAGGRIFLQLWHVGRASHPDFHDGELPVGPSAIAPEGNVYTRSGWAPIPAPRALEIDEIPGVVEQFAQGARNAKAAGFDGVQIHGANGYLLDQFMRDGCNQRTDAYGGSIANRCRFPIEVAEAVVGVWGPERVGYKLTPWSRMLSAIDSTPVETMSHLVRALDALKLGHLEVVERAGDPGRPEGMVPITPVFRKLFGQTLVMGGGYDLVRAEAALAAGEGDLVAFGMAFLANPDLPRRLRDGAGLNAPDQASFYQGEPDNDARGYTDYPALDA